MESKLAPARGGVVALLGLALLVPVSLHAQEARGRITGRVVDTTNRSRAAVKRRSAARLFDLHLTVGAVLPEAGITYYDVPQTVATTPYRYTVVNGQTVLVEPRSRRVVQVID